MHNNEQLNSPLGKNPKDNGGTNYRNCPNFNGFYLLNELTGEMSAVGCKRYDCVYCGKRKAYKLQKALEKRLYSYNHIRLATFTFRTSIFANQLHCMLRASEIWRRFINNMRREKSLTATQRNFQYIKVLEFTQSGFVHFHVIISQFLPWSIVQYHWLNAINVTLSISGKNGHVNLKASQFEPKRAARYVAKYITKSAGALRKFVKKYYPSAITKFKLYTKSSLIVIWEKKVPSGQWSFYIDMSEFRNLNLSLLETSSPFSAQNFDNWYNNNEINITSIKQE